MNIGNAIRHFRKRNRLTQSQLAETAGISQTYLSQIESNLREPHISTLGSLSESLRIPLPILMFYSLESSDIPNEKQALFNSVDASVKSLINELIKVPQA